MSLNLPDMTQVLQETTRKGVGARRWQRPLFVDLLPPCNHACPAGENIQSWLAHAQDGEYEKAWRVLVDDNPLPSTHGRACYHPCETGCNRASLDTPIAIHAVERFLGDRAADEGWRVPVATPSGKKVLVVGAGPGGLACAYHLARMGHQVEIRDGAEEPGGMMTFGIPAYRLPRAPLRREISHITAMPGITLRCGHRVDDVIGQMSTEGFDAVFVAVGAQEADHLDIPAMDGKKLIDAITLLGDVRQGRRPQLGRTVAVIGGGDVAVDAARTARRLGATDALLVYRRDKPHMKAAPSEASEAFAEGVKVKWLSTVERFGAAGIVIEKVQMNPDGGLTPTGETERLAADSVVLAVGQHSDLSPLRGADGVRITTDDVVAVDEVLMTGHPGIFAGGDCIGGARTMTAAVGHGKLAARAIDAWMRRETYQHPPSHPLVTFGMLHLLDYLDAPRSHQPEVPPMQRSGFGEIVAGLDEAQARYEAQRCLSCGNCFECDNCYAACPEQAITRLGPGRGYSVDMNLCTGCATCFEQCPCHAIDMVPEPGGSAPAGGLGEALAPSGFEVRR